MFESDIINKNQPMIVHYANKLWELDMPYELFESLKRGRKPYSVLITEKTNSSYKKQTTVYVTELEDYSIMRNTNALKKH